MAQPSHAFDRKYFSSGSYDSYKDDVLSWTRPMARKIFSYIKDSKHHRVLDVGCAEGYLMDELYTKYDAEVQGIEFSTHALFRALPSIKKFITKSSLFDAQIPSRKYDAIICFDVFEYLTPSENKKAAQILVRASRDYIFFANPYKHSFQGSQKLNPDSLRITAFTQKEYQKIFKDAGARSVGTFNAGSGSDILVFRTRK
ncbi:MAG: class I SAM-dependent methyltransferase [Candidatus Ryanbacteria bacterium]|nr:class I SAM-dependent methyltransferase [Candidatus Ryanbacteria bacterium]